MTNQQLYLAIGVPVIIYLFGFTLNVFVIIWQAHSLEKRFEGVEKRIDSFPRTEGANPWLKKTDS